MKSAILGDRTRIMSDTNADVLTGDASIAHEELDIQKSSIQTCIIPSHADIFDDAEISRLYTPIDIAKEEIWRRWNNKELKAEVEKFLGNDVPRVFQDEPSAVLGRHIASPNREAVHFLKLAQQVELQPLFLEYLSDKFVPENTDKYYLGKLSFYNGTGKRGGEIITNTKIIDIGAEDGQSIRNINTLWGEALTEFHHRMFRSALSKEQSFFDMSSWFATHGGKSIEYYLPYLALFLCHSVLIEEFLTYNKKDRRFVEEVVVPAMMRLEVLFGMKPLIVPLFHLNSLNDLGDDGKKWMQHPESLKKLIPREYTH